jgi:general secretion pathway protein D
MSFEIARGVRSHAALPARRANPLRATVLPLIGLMIIASLLAGCAASPIEQGHDLWAQGRFEDAVLLLQKASAQKPGDRPLEAAYHRQRDRALSQLFVAAENSLSARYLDEAQDLFQRALRLDANSARAKEGLERVAIGRWLETDFAQATQWAEEGRNAAAEKRLRQILATDPNYSAAKRLLRQVRERQRDLVEIPAALKGALATPVSVEFRDTAMRNVFEVLARVSGLNFVFDRDVKTDTKITIFVRDDPIEDVLKVLLSTNALDRKVLNENTLLVYPNTPAKNKEYQELVVRTFYLANADAKQIESLLKSLVHLKDVYIDEKINSVVVRDTADAVRLAERVIRSIDIPDAEVMLELEVVELSHTRALNLGIQLPTSITRGSSSPIGANTSSNGAGTTGASTGGSIATSNFSSLITTIPNPLLMANLSMTDNDSNLLANPRIRVRNREKAKVLIGEKLPVITSTAVQNAGVASSVSYIDVGLKLEVEPQVYLNDEVGVKILLEVNSNLGEVTVGNSTTGVTTAYQVGTRSAQTVLRLHDGETQVLAGLINDNESDSWNKVPGLSDIPGIGRLFSNDNSSHEKTEIVLLVTPHILRNLDTPDGDPMVISAGTEAAVGVAPLSIGHTAARSMSMRGDGSNAGPGRAAQRVGGERGDRGAQAQPGGDDASNTAPTPAAGTALAPPEPPPAAAAPAAGPNPAPPPGTGAPGTITLPPKAPVDGSFPPAPGSTFGTPSKDNSN